MLHIYLHTETVLVLIERQFRCSLTKRRDTFSYSPMCTDKSLYGIWFPT